MTDEDLERLLRQSNPLPMSVDDGLTARQRATLDSIVAAPYRAPYRPRRLTWLITAPVAAVAVIVVAALAVLNPFSTQRAVAWGPAPLVYTAGSSSLEETIGMAIEKARATDTPTEAERGAVSTSWNLHVNEAGTPQQVTQIVPTVADLNWAEDLSGRLVTSVGDAYSADGADHPSPGEDAPRAGDILDDRVYGPGEYPALVPNAYALDAASIETILSVVVDPALPGDALPLIQGLLSEWTLTGEQHAALLETLMSFDNLHLLGTTTDRLGREVIGLAAPSSDNREATFFLSTSTGRVIGVEQTVLGDDDLLGVPAGTVISYTMWKDTK